jgi:hypothetical protein
MNHKTLAIAPIVAVLSVILVVGTNIGIMQAHAAIFPINIVGKQGPPGPPGPRGPPHTRGATRTRKSSTECHLIILAV